MPYTLYVNENGTLRRIANLTESEERAASSIRGIALSGRTVVLTKGDGSEETLQASSLIAGKADALAAARTIDGVSFNGTENISHYGECSTAAATAAKTVACPGFTLSKGASVTVKFTVANTASGVTLNVNGTGAKSVRYQGTAISPEVLQAGKIYSFVYTGSVYECIGDITGLLVGNIRFDELGTTVKINISKP